MMSKHQGWVASLDDGSTIFEPESQEGSLSGWQQLIRHCSENGLEITMMRLQRGGVTVIASSGADGYVQAYEARMSYGRGGPYIVQGIGSVFGNEVFITWLNDQGSVWHDVRQLESMATHAAMRK